MSASSQAKSRGGSWRKVLYTVVAFILAFVMLETNVAIVAMVQVGFHLVLGWLTFLVKSLPQASIDGGLLASFVIGFSLAVVCTHIVMRHFMRHWSGSARAWRWKWTLSILGIPILLFGICVSTQGAVTTSRWLFSGPLAEDHSRLVRRAFAARLARYGKAIAESERQAHLPNHIHSIFTYLGEGFEDRQRYYVYRDPDLNDVPEYWTWLGGVTLKSPGDVPVAFAPRTDRSGARVVSFLDGTTRECTEEEWQAALSRWRQAVLDAEKSEKMK